MLSEGIDQTDYPLSIDLFVPREREARLNTRQNCHKGSAPFPFPAAATMCWFVSIMDEVATREAAFEK
jgi:hypothetical protein